MNTRYILLIMTVQLACISSCAVIIQRPPDQQTNSTLTPITSTIPVNPPRIQIHEDPKNSLVIQQSELLDKQDKKNNDTHRPTIKLTLCNVFVPPMTSEVPRVDLIKLNAIPANDHESVKNLLIDNIQAIHEHSKKAEEALRTAILAHRKSCTSREVLDKK
jgi:hypothetical protein